MVMIMAIMMMMMMMIIIIIILRFVHRGMYDSQNKYRFNAALTDWFL